MATALARTMSVYPDPTRGLVLTLEVGYSGTEVPGGADVQPIQVQILAEDQPAAIRTKMSQAVIADATSRGYSLVGSSLTLPTFQKG